MERSFYHKIEKNVGLNELNKHIDDADFGIAQGTSILEIAKRGKPVIVAPYFSLFDALFKQYRVLGIFGKTTVGAELDD